MAVGLAADVGGSVAVGIATTVDGTFASTVASKSGVSLPSPGIIFSEVSDAPPVHASNVAIDNTTAEADARTPK